MKWLKKIWYAFFPHDEWTEVHPAIYYEADRLIRTTENFPEKEKWRICPAFEDRNRIIGVVWIGKRRRNNE